MEPEDGWDLSDYGLENVRHMHVTWMNPQGRRN